MLGAGRIDEAQLHEGLRYQQRYGGRLGRILVMQEALTEAALVEALSEALSVPAVDLSRETPDPRALATVRAGFALKHDIFPLRFEASAGGGERLLVATCDPQNFRLIDELSFMANAEVRPVLATPGAIDQAIYQHYGAAQGTTPRVLRGAILAGGDGGSEMTLVRPSGAEEQVHTGARGGQPPEPPPPPPPEPILLTDPKPVRQPPDRAPTTPHASPFDAALGDLLQQAEQAATVEAVERLQRMFWALVRALGRRGLITGEELERELGELEDRDD